MNQEEKMQTQNGRELYKKYMKERKKNKKPLEKEDYIVGGFLLFCILLSIVMLGFVAYERSKLYNAI